MPSWPCFNLGMTEGRRLTNAVALYGIIEQLVREAPLQPTGASPGSGVAGHGDALAAVAQLAKAIEVPAQAGDLDPDQAHRMASLLLVIRDFVDPLGPDVDEHVNRFLSDVVRGLNP
jgi:hypothetical protein